MGMDPRQWGFRPGNYEFRPEDNESRPSSQDLAPNTYRIPFFSSWQSVIVRTTAVTLMLVVLVLVAMYFGLVPH